MILTCSYEHEQHQLVQQNQTKLMQLLKMFYGCRLSIVDLMDICFLSTLCTQAFIMQEASFLSGNSKSLSNTK